MVVGVNGVGKTTTIGKLAYQFKKAEKKLFWVQQILLGLRRLTNFKYGQTEQMFQL